MVILKKDSKTHTNDQPKNWSFEFISAHHTLLPKSICASQMITFTRKMRK